MKPTETLYSGSGGTVQAVWTRSRKRKRNMKRILRTKSDSYVKRGIKQDCALQENKGPVEKEKNNRE